MRHERNERTDATGRHRGLRAAALTFALCLLAAPALAHGKHSGHGPGHGHRKAGQHKHQAWHAPVPHRYVVAPRGFVAPPVIRPVHAPAYRPYHAGAVWYGPHRHEHAVYRFPVYRDGRYLYEPHYYCGDRLSTAGHLAIDGPRFRVRVAF